ncbi:MAG: TerB family tellurite resistance protein [Robiginitomaculum sp.]|nr:TerB family tellurite resistance protein [Robiginitomaculum sp.]
MLEKLRRMFQKTTPPSKIDIQQEARECSIALLVEAALSDGIYANIEQDIILNVIKQSFALSDADAAELLEKAEQRADMAVDHYAFTSVIKKNMPKEQRVALIGHLWDVTFADGEESPFEDALIRRVASLLAVTDHERASAKRAAVQRSKKP